MLHTGVPYDLLHGQVEGHETFIIRTSSIFNSFSPPLTMSCQMITDLIQQYIDTQSV